MTFTASMFFASSVIAQDTPQTVEVRWWVGNHSEGGVPFKCKGKFTGKTFKCSAPTLIHRRSGGKITPNNKNQRYHGYIDDDEGNVLVRCSYMFAKTNWPKTYAKFEAKNCVSP